MAFKMVTLSEKEVGRIAGNAGAHADTMAVDLTERWRAELPDGQEIVDLKQAQMCVRNDLLRMRREMEVIERDHLGQLDLDNFSRETRDETIPQLRGKLVGIQNLFEGNYGAGTSTRIFGTMVTVIPLDPFPLRRVGNRAYERLTDSGFVLPPSQLGGVEVAPVELARSFEQPLTRLDAVLVELEDTLPITNASLEKKIRALAELRRQVGVAARFLEALYYLAGHDEIARRVRVSSHRSRRLEPPAVDDAAGAGSGEPRANDAEPESPDDATATEAAEVEEPASDEAQVARAA